MKREIDCTKYWICTRKDRVRRGRAMGSRCLVDVQKKHEERKERHKRK